MSGGNRATVLRRGHAAGGGSSGGHAAGNGNGGSGSVGSSYVDSLTDDQLRTLRRRIETIRSLEQEIDVLKEDRVWAALQSLGVDASASAGALSGFKRPGDWAQVEPEAVEQFGRAPRLTWDMLKKAVAEEEKYQSKKNWSSTKGRGHRKAPVARRLDAEALKKLGVFPTQQFLALAQCDTCGRQVNAHFLKDHQEQHCLVPAARRGAAAAAAATAVAAAVAKDERPEVRKDAKHAGV
ncbi:hypothetical protein IWQ56_002494, partial [Coemansia nantahalensis]